MLLINDRPINHFFFSAGEVQVKLPPIETERATLTWCPINSDDIMMLLMTVNALKHAGISDVMLDILYLPYARQDRVCSAGESFSLEVMCGLLDNLNLTGIKLWDVHNEEETFKLFDSTYIINTEVWETFKQYKVLDDFELDNLILCAPDNGAMERVTQVCEKLDLWNPMFLDKKRNPDTGAIEGIQFHKHSRIPDGENILIVDDICDGGRTFIEAAKLLRERNVGKLYLYVTHGIFSNGLDDLLEHFEHIYCHHVLHAFNYISTDRLTILKEFDYE